MRPGGMVLRARQVFRVREEKARRVRSPARQAKAKKRQECPVARQERRGRVAGVGQPREERDQEPRDDEERSDDPRRPRHAEADRERHAAVRAVPRHVGEVLGRDRAEEKESEDPSDRPGFPDEDGGDEGPTGDLEQAPARQGDRQVRGQPVPFRPAQSGERVDEARQGPDAVNEERRVETRGGLEPLHEGGVWIRDDQPGRNDRDHVEEGRHGAGPGNRDLARDERPAGLVLPVDLQVGDLVDDVRGGIHRRSAERTDRDGQDDRPRHAARRVGIVRGPEGADRAGDDPQERRQQREGAREADVSPHPPSTGR